ncbi:MAG: YkgJ family cysteine cluster protein [bacterium]
MTDPVDQIRAVHRAIQKLADEKAGMHGDRLQCKRGCSACCMDGLTVFEVEADRILADFDGVDLGAPSLNGCVFLGEQGECRIYASRPYVCRTQGLPLRWFDDEAQPPTEYRDICELNLVLGPG